MKATAMGSELRGKDNLTRRFADGYDIACVDDGFDYWDLALRCMRNDIATRPPPHSTHYVRFFDHAGRSFVFKRMRNDRTRFRRVLLNWWTGESRMTALMRKVERAVAAGCTVAQRIYMVAEKQGCRRSGETILLLEFIPGAQPSLDNNDATADVVRGIREAMATLHTFGICQSDPSVRNFIVSEPDGEIRAVDIYPRGTFFRIDRLRDLLCLQNFYGVEPELDNVIDRILYGYLVHGKKARRFFRGKAREKPDS